MKAILLTMFTFLAITAQAEVPFYVCGYGELDKLATYDAGYTNLTSLNLTDDQRDHLKMQFDFEFNCNEGVILKGAKFDDQLGTKVLYQARCIQDSLGTKTVELPLFCTEAYLN